MRTNRGAAHRDASTEHHGAGRSSDCSLKLPQLRLHRNTLGRGVLNAMKSGLRAARAPYVLVTMGDGSGQSRRYRSDVPARSRRKPTSCGSRYIAWRTTTGGAAASSERLSGPRPIASLARRLSRCTTRTSNFRLYSKRLLNQVTIESTGGFELGIELTIKAHLLGMRVAECPLPGATAPQAPVALNCGSGCPGT